MSTQNVISIASRTRSDDRAAQQSGKALQRVVQTKQIVDGRLAQMQRSQVRDLVAERHAKQIVQKLNAILGYAARP